MRTVYREHVIIRVKHLKELHAYNAYKAPPDPYDLERWRSEGGNVFAILEDSDNPVAFDCYEEEREASVREIMSLLTEGKQPPRFLDVIPCDGRRRQVIDLEHLILLEILYDPDPV